MEFRKATQNDADILARMHLKYLHWGFLSALGRNVLRTVYASLAYSNESVVFVAEEDGTIAGFVSGVLDLRRYYGHFFKRNAVKILPYVVVRPVFINKFFETLSHPFKKKCVSKDIKIPRQELLSIVVCDEYQGRGVSKELFELMSDWFTKEASSGFMTTVGETNSKSINFFKKMGCRIVGEEEIHRGEVSKIFVCERDEI